MERKTISAIMLTLLLLGMLTLAFNVQPAHASPGFQPGTGETTKINLVDAAQPGLPWVTYPDGQQYVKLNYDVGETFTVWANVTNVTELNLYQVGVTYNDTILTCTSYSEGSTSQNFFYLNVDPAAYAPVVHKPIPADGYGFLGKWNHVAWALAKPYNASGTGVLAVFDFEVLDYGVTLIDIIISGAPVAILGDVANTDLDYNTVDIVFDNTWKPERVVGGKATPINIPINKPELQIPWMWLTTIILSLVLIVGYVKKRKKNTGIKS